MLFSEHTYLETEKHRGKTPSLRLVSFDRVFFHISKEAVLTVIQPQLDNEGLARNAHHVISRRSLEHLIYPPICPCCGASATQAITIAKPFMFTTGIDSGWGYRVAVAHPFFCATCVAHHRAQAKLVTVFDLMTSVLSQQLVLPALGLGFFGGFILLTRAIAFLRKPSNEWPLIVGAELIVLIALYCARSAWYAGAYKRIPAQTRVSACFDFGDNDDSATFEITARTYAIRSAEYAIAFSKLNHPE